MISPERPLTRYSTVPMPKCRVTSLSMVATDRGAFAATASAPAESAANRVAHRTPFDASGA